ncbi:MAG: transcriptional regulator [Candidatus Thorarchaeota archaeon]|jgi:predicted transcriptional regulator
MSASESKKEKQVKRRTWMMPQEVEVWYVLPAIRRELAKVMKTKLVPRANDDGKLVDHKITQKEIARMLGVTEPAITQYLLKKKGQRSRGDQVSLPDHILREIDKSADRMIADYEKARKADDEDIFQTMTSEINRIITVMRDAGVMCDIHREFCAHANDPCEACDTK